MYHCKCTKLCSSAASFVGGICRNGYIFHSGNFLFDMLFGTKDSSFAIGIAEKGENERDRLESFVLVWALDDAEAVVKGRKIWKGKQESGC